MPLTINKDAAICRASLASQLDTVLLEKVLGITFSLKDTSTSDVWEAGGSIINLQLIIDQPV